MPCLEILRYNPVQLVTRTVELVMSISIHKAIPCIPDLSFPKDILNLVLSRKNPVNQAFDNFFNSETVNSSILVDVIVRVSGK